jgi:hypothetical protein
MLGDRAVATMCAIVAMGLLPAAATAAPPSNDDFLSAVPINRGATQMPRERIDFTVDTAEATVQSELFHPPRAGGPPEPTACTSGGRTTSFGKTVWYTFTPDERGSVEFDAAGFNTVLALIPLQNSEPQGYTCVNDLDGPSETLRSRVQAHTAYALQVGGAVDQAGTPASGQLDLSVLFTPDRDGDGVPDNIDPCPSRPGPINGCPPQLHAGYTAAWNRSSNGLLLTYFTVTNAPTGSLINIRCSPGCGNYRRRATGGRLEIRQMRGTLVPRNAEIEIRVTKPGYFGSYLKLRATAGLSESSACLLPGSDRPQKSCH